MMEHRLSRLIVIGLVVGRVMRIVLLALLHIGTIVGILVAIWLVRWIALVGIDARHASHSVVSAIASMRLWIRIVLM